MGVMPDWLRLSRTSPKNDATPAAQAGPPADHNALDRVVRDVASQAAGLGMEAARLNGVLDDVSKVAQRQADSFTSLGERIGQMVESNGQISRAIESTLQSASAARRSVERVADDVLAAQKSLDAVAQVASGITRIALQTRLVAFNAAVEAKRAGDAGRGFMVVAEAVRELSERVQASSTEIAGTVDALKSSIGELERNVREKRRLADGNPSFSLAFAEVLESTHAIADRTRANLQSCDATRAALQDLQGEVAGTGTALNDARSRAEAFLTASEHLIQVAADQGAETADTPYIDKVIALAAEVSAAFEAGVRDGKVRLEDLFDEDYRPVQGSNPAQVMTKFVAFTDLVLPPIQEAALQFSSQVVFCAAVDRNGYLPTHNRKFSQPQGQDPVWNAANCRNRRIFNDRTGAAAGRHRQRFLLQTYRRDLGGGQYAMMKDVSAPIVVGGRHWGGVRLAYRF